MRCAPGRRRSVRSHSANAYLLQHYTVRPSFPPPLCSHLPSCHRCPPLHERPTAPQTSPSPLVCSSLALPLPRHAAPLRALHTGPDRPRPLPRVCLLIGVSGWRARSPIPSVCGIRPGGATRSAFASGWAVPVWPAQHPRAGRRGRPRVSCEYASLDVHDVLGHHRVNVTKNVGKYSVDSDLKWTGRVVRAAGPTFLPAC